MSEQAPAPARLPDELCPECGERATECMCGREVGAGEERRRDASDARESWPARPAATPTLDPASVGQAGTSPPLPALPPWRVDFGIVFAGTRLRLGVEIQRHSAHAGASFSAREMAIVLATARLHYLVRDLPAQVWLEAIHEDPPTQEPTR